MDLSLSLRSLFLATCLVSPAVCLPLSAEPIRQVGGEEPKVTLPAELKARAGRLVTITVETNGRMVRWLSLSKECDLLPIAGSKQAVFVAPARGRYEVMAWTALGDVPSEPAVLVVVVEGGPEPGPTPPTPEPDALTKLLQEAFDQEGSGKLKMRDLLVQVYRKGAEDTSQRAENDTPTKVLAVLRVAATELIGDGLPKVRRAIADELNKALPRQPDKVLTAEDRVTFKRELARFADALEKLK